jgi:hypothetical protein
MSPITAVTVTGNALLALSITCFAASLWRWLQKRAERWSNLRAPRTPRLPKLTMKNMKSKPANSRYE